ncbi:MAG: dihydroorotase [Pseudomonadales bacterium]|nr:dihydroorotase [Pseudomonadales bacterium]
MDFSRGGRTVANLLLKQVRVIDPLNKKDEIADVYIQQGEIAGFNQAPNNFQADITIAGNRFWLLPGAIDLCARIREPGQEFKGNIHSETKAAAAGGITHLICPPDTQPVVDTPAVAKLIQERAHQSGYSHVLPLGALTKNLQGELLSEMHALHEAGCAGVAQLRAPIKNSKILLRCLEYAATFNLTVFFQSQDSALADKGVAHGGINATSLGLASIPASAETIALSRDLILVEQTGVKAHFGQLSCARSVELIAQAQARGLAVTADVAAHQLVFTEENVDGFDSVHHVIPPYRTNNDRLALLAGVRDGIIGMICSDHQPHEAAAKAAPFAETEAGISSIETLLPSSFQWVQDNTLDVNQWVSSISTNPAKLLALDAGHLAAGSLANAVLFDPNGSTTIDSATLFSEGKNSPWLHRELPGKVMLTLCDGHISYKEPLSFT